MMFSKSALLTLTVALLGSVTAVPTGYGNPALVQRDIRVIGLRSVPQEPIAIIKRGTKVKPVIINRQIDVEEAVKTDGNGNVVPYDRFAKRQETYPAELPSRGSKSGAILPFKRQETYPAELPSRGSKSGAILPFKRQISAEDAVKTDGNGNVVPYDRRAKRQETYPAELPSRGSKSGAILPFKRQETYPAELPSRGSKSGAILPFKRQTNVQDAVKTDANGNIVAYDRLAKRQELPYPAELPSRGRGGKVVPF